jgi:hypothetical protein
MRLPALLLLSTVLAGASTEQPRLVLSLEAKAGRLAVGVENATRETIAVKALTYVTLSSGRVEDAEPPRYWAKVEVQTLPAATRPMQLGPLAKQRVMLEPDGMLWASDRFTPGQPLARTVVPGAYRMGVQVRNHDGTTWQSNEVGVRVDVDGSLTF